MPAGQGFLIVGLCDKHHADVPTRKPVIQQAAYLGEKWARSLSFVTPDL